MKPKGRLITFEGGEGVGKSSQIVKLSHKLKNHGIPTLATREPGGTEIGEIIRSALLKGRSDRMELDTELLLLFACRTELIQRVILPALNQGTWVVCDRFVDSTLAYQGYGRGMSMTVIQSLMDHFVRGLQPDRTYLLDCDPELGLQRSWQRLDGTNSSESRFESLDLAFHSRVRQGFLNIAREHPERCRKIAADQSMDTIEDIIWKDVNAAFLNLENECEK